MGLFKKIGNATLLKSLEWQDSTKETMVYKYPMNGNQIFFGSKITVRESQAAVFLNKGEIADVFTSGMYTLKASNLPILSSLLALPFGFKSPFYADVYFVNTKQFTNQKWGTTNPITLRDKEFGTIRIKSYGTYAFKVNDASVFLKELFGTNSSFTTEDITSYLKSMLISAISDTIAESKISAIDLACNLLEFNEVAKNAVGVHFEKLGLKLTNLVIENISFPESVEKAIDTRASMGVLGDKMDTYVKYQSAEALRDAAKNQGVAGFGTQMGTGIALGEMMKESLKKEEQPKAEAPKQKFCTKCGAGNKQSARFCAECGEKFTSESNCPDCGAKLSANAKFCPECGKKIR